MDKHTQNLFLTREKIPPNSEAIRIVDKDGNVQFVCIESPMERKNERFYWLAYGKFSFQIKRLIKSQLLKDGITALGFKRLKHGELVNRRVSCEHHRLCDKADFGRYPVVVLLLLSLSLNAAILAWVYYGWLF